MVSATHAQCTFNATQPPHSLHTLAYTWDKKNGNLLWLQTVAAAAWLSAERLIGPSRAAQRLHRHPGLIICRQPVFSPFNYGFPCYRVRANRVKWCASSHDRPANHKSAPCRGEMLFRCSNISVKFYCNCFLFLFFNLILTLSHLYRAIAHPSCQTPTWIVFSWSE